MILGLANDAVLERFDGAETLEVALDESRGVRGGQACSLGKAVVAHAIQHAVVDHLGDASMIGRDALEGNAQHLGRGDGVRVLALLECLQQRRVVGHMRQHPQLDLTVVGRQQHRAFARDERPPHAFADVGANRNVLQVGVARAQPTRRSDGLIKRGMHTARIRIDQLLKRIDVGALELL